MFLGAYVQKKTKRKLDIWPGECHVHAAMTYEEIKNLRDDFPDSEVLIHPECACGSEAMYYSEKNNDKEMHFLSTEAMINKSKEIDSKNLIIATETGVIHKMKKLSPDKNFIPINRSATCKYMKMITLDKVLSALKSERPEVKVAKDISIKAKTAIDRMVSIG
jgi:quinolinate synthase